ncbi:MAG: hypothetical protein JW700_00330 [Candidatus Aenigmarchaeota archaeon]|nr:hypothetical protein [Candidatus Aenigmarchaeota archaeon]
MKGQVFILISIFVLIFLFSLRAGTETVEIMQSDMFLDDFNNLKSEIVSTIDTSLLNRQSVEGNLDDFISFTEDFYARKGYNQTVAYSVSRTSNQTAVLLNITLQSSNSYLSESLIIRRDVLVFQ